MTLCDDQTSVDAFRTLLDAFPMAEHALLLTEDLHGSRRDEDLAVHSDP